MSDSDSVTSERLEMFGQKSQTNMLVAGNTLAEQSRNSSRREKMHRWAVGPGLQYVLAATFALIHVVVFALGILNHYPNGKLAGSFSILGDACSIARAAALVLQLDAAILIFPVCRTLMSLLRRTFMSRFVRFDESISFHTQVAWFMVFFAWVHAISHWMAVAHLAAKKPHGLKGFLFISFATRPGWTGWIMLITLMIMAATSLKRLRQSNNKRFLNTHDLAILFFVCWSVHGALGIVKTDEAVSAGRLGPFVQYWVCGGFTYLLELVLRELRGRQRTLITKVIQHPNNVVEIQIKKENLKPRIGQYIYLCCPEVSVSQYNMFTLTSAPEEDYLSVHVHCVSEFAKSLARSFGCYISQETDVKALESSTVISIDHAASKFDVDPAIRKILPRVFIDGPYGSASEHVFKHEVAVLVGAGAGIMPFASILKSIWYRLNYPHYRTRLGKVYFFWICHNDFASFEWFRSLLLALEAQDIDGHIEIYTYAETQLESPGITVDKSTDRQNTFTGLRAPTYLGQPEWDNIFKSIHRAHKSTEAGVFYSGPEALGNELQVKCNIQSEPDFKFTWKGREF